MSLIHEQKTSAATRAPSRSLWRRFRFPLIVLAVFGGIFAIPWICIGLGVDTDGAMMLLMLTQWHAPALAVLLLLVWWLFFSAFRRLTRLAVLALAIVAGAGLYFSVRQVELTKGRVGLVPRLHFIWEPTAKERLDAYLAQQPATDDDLPPIDAKIGSEDFPRYRGANFDGVVSFARLETDWARYPPKVLWQHPCPGGYSGVAVAGNIAVTLEQRDGEETIVCYDRATGRQRWLHPYGAFYKDAMKMGDGPRSTPTIHSNYIFSIGATGELVCLNVNGKKQWGKNILSVAKAKNIKWGLTGSPLIVDDLVVAHAGIDPDAPADSSLIAFEQTTGEIRWQKGHRKAGYSSPQLAVLDNTPQILLFDGEGLVSYDKAGNELWQHRWVTYEEMNSIQPVIVGSDRVFISSELSNGCAMLHVKAPDKDKASWRVMKVWENKNLAARYANPVTDGKSIFGLHNLQGVLTCLDAETGSVKWKGNREGPGQMLLADAVLLVVNGDTGEVALFETDSAECNQLARYRVFETRDKTWNTPALAGDQLFVRNQAEIACLKLPRR
jgi:outer membrane protein assembly factor BamB